MNKKFLSALFIGSVALLPECAYSQTSLKFENGGGPAGNGPSTTDKVVTMYNGDAGVYSPATTATFSITRQVYTYANGSSSGSNGNIKGLMFGTGNSNSSNVPPGAALYSLMNSIGSGSNAQFSSDGAVPAINVANDYAIELTGQVNVLMGSNNTNLIPTNAQDVDFGDITITFNRPVNNPIIHIMGLGGQYIHSSNTVDQGFALGFELVNPEYTLTRLSGSTYFTVNGNTIRNTATKIGTSSTAGSSPYGAGGTVRVNGTGITSIVLKAIVRGDGGTRWSNNSYSAGDGILLGVTLVKNNVSGTVFNDNNGGTPDGTGYGGVTVNLRDANGNIVATTTTAADGTYSFANVLNADYMAEIVSPNGFEHVGSSAGTTNGIVPVPLSGTNVSGIDFGINQPPVAGANSVSNQAPGQAATIPNILGNDTDPNGGTLSPDSVRLIPPASATGIQTTNGRVTGFTVPGEGNWIYNSNGAVTFTPLAGFTGDPAPIKYTVTDAAGLLSNQATLSVDYNDPVTISGTVFNDNNGGTPDGSGYGGVTVVLKNGQGDTVAVTATAPDGSYSFTGIIPGDYTIAATPPAGLEHVGSAAGNTTGIIPVTVGSTAVTGQDFGINQPPLATNDTLSNQVYGAAATLDIISNDSDPNGGSLSTDSISLLAPVGATNIQTNTTGKITGFTVPGEGAWAYNGDGTLTFSPVSGFIADPAPIQYTVSDNAGLKSEPATITIHYGTPLPVILMYFNAVAGQCNVLLQWATATEERFHRFEVERSVDGHNFRFIGKVSAKGNNSKYVFEDQSLMGGNYFYRLNLADVDGRSVYSKVVPVITTCDQHTITIYPNPTPDNWTVDIPGTDPVSLELYDISGKKVRAITDALSRAALTGEDLAAGVYLLKATFNNRVSNHQLIKQ